MFAAVLLAVFILCVASAIVGAVLMVWWGIYTLINYL